MCELLGMSANVPTDIRFSFAGLAQRGGNTGPHRDGWGITVDRMAHGLGHTAEEGPHWPLQQQHMPTGEAVPDLSVHGGQRMAFTLR